MHCLCLPCWGQDTELDGYPVPKGLTVGANLYAMHRHPNYWPEPDTWLPQRWLPDAEKHGLGGPGLKEAFLPFSTGPRSCIGRNFAMLQMTLAAAVLAGWGLGFEEAPGKPEVQLYKGMTMQPRQGVWLKPVMLAKGR